MFLSVFSLQGGQTPMHVATYYGNVTLVLILLQHGGSPDITNVVSLYVFQNKNSECFLLFLFGYGCYLWLKLLEYSTWV